jgi:predicted ATPase
MRLLVRSGHRHLALRQYQHLQEALRRELDTDPDPRIQELHRRIQSGAYAGEPAPPSLPASTQVRNELLTVDEPPLIGREQEMRALQPALDRLFAGRGSLVLLRGNAGIGKSRLAAEIAERVSGLGASVLWGDAYADGQQAPYGPFVVAMESFAIRLSSDGLRAIAGEAAPELARLVPAIATAIGPGTERTKPLDRRRLYGAVAGFLLRLASRSPVMLVLDDLHLADGPSLDLLRYLARTLRDAPLLLLGTERPAAGGLSGSGRPGTTTIVEVEPLDRADVARLVDALLRARSDAALYDAIDGTAQGNPFYIVESVQALAGRGLLDHVGGTWRLRPGAKVPGRQGLRQREA